MEYIYMSNSYNRNENENLESNLNRSTEKGNSLDANAFLIDGLEVFCDQEGVPYVRSKDQNTAHPIKSEAASTLIRKALFEKTNQVPSGKAVGETIDRLEGFALLSADKRDLPIRTVVRDKEDGSSVVEIDTGRREAVVVSAGGYGSQITNTIFRRPGTAAELPEPAKSGSLDLLWQVLPVKDPDQQKLIVAFIVVSSIANCPAFPLLSMEGPAGSAKTSAMEIIAGLIDPSPGLARALPRSERDLAVSAHNRWCVTFDNLDHIKGNMSDALCRLTTGGSFAARALYTDADERLLTFRRPVIATGIGDYIRRSDLMTRSMVITLPPLSEAGGVRPKQQVFAEYERLKPQILAGLYNGISSVLRNLESTKENFDHRAADFLRYATAAEEGLGWAPGSFEKVFMRHQDRQQSTLALSDVVVREVCTVIAGEDGDVIEHTASDLYQAVTSGFLGSRPAAWPKDPAGLSKCLTQRYEQLKSLGLILERGRTGKSRSLVFKKLPGFNAAEHLPQDSNTQYDDDELV
ncbi:hypothetical protein NBRC116588_28560 [Pyruvatibacter sp. HU-CL02332]